jgi:hypothetical protein
MPKKQNRIITRSHQDILFRSPFFVANEPSYVMAYDEDLAGTLGIDNSKTFAKFYSVLYDLVQSGQGSMCSSNDNYDYAANYAGDDDGGDEVEDNEDEDEEEEQEEEEEEEEEGEEENDE